MAIEVLKRNKKVSYRAVYYGKGVRRSKCFSRKYDAHRWLDEQGSLTQYGHQEKLKFSEACRIWLENHSRLKKSPACYEFDRRMILTFNEFFKESFLEGVSPEKIEKYISYKKTEELSNATVNRYLQCLRAIFNYFIKKQRIIVNPVSIVGLLPEEMGASSYLSFKEAEVFLDYADRKYKDHNRWVYRFYLLAINTGMRWGEIIALQSDRIDFSNRIITISRSYCRVSKKIRETTKGGKVRYVGINQALLPELKRQLKEVGDGLVFKNKSGKILNRKNFDRDFFSKDLVEAGVRKIRFHDLRHTFASHFVMKDGGLYDLQKLLGHHDAATTERYAHLSPETLTSKTELVSIGGAKNKQAGDSPINHPQTKRSRIKRAVSN